MALSTSKILSSLFEPELFDLGFSLDADFLSGRSGYQATFNTFLYLKKISFFCREALYVFTANPAYYLFDFLNKPWQEFYEKELKQRKKFNLPPWGLIAKVTLRAKDENRLLQEAQNLYNRFKQNRHDVYGPLKEFPFKLRGKFRYSLIIKSKKSSFLRQAVKKEIQGLLKPSLQIAVSLE